MSISSPENMDAKPQGVDSFDLSVDSFGLPVYHYCQLWFDYLLYPLAVIPGVFLQPM